MKVSFVSSLASPETFASTRIRSWLPCQGLREMGIDATVGFDREASIFVINKNVSAAMYWAIGAAKKMQKSKVIYDLCDFPLRPDMVKICDVITVPSDIMKLELLKQTDKPIYVVKDSIDFGLLEPVVRKSQPPVVGWFGNFNTAKESVEILQGIPLPKKVITQKLLFEREYKNKLDNLIVTEWSYQNFKKDFEDIGLSIFALSPENFYKSDNKTLLSIALGVPVMVSKGSAGWHFLESCYKGLGGMSEIRKGHILDNDIDEAQIYYAQKKMFKERTYLHQAAELLEILYICQNQSR